ncbi:VirD4-like conjugal transfer protein, CD1115 family [Bacillus sp. FJAT-28004]|uniref:VirD4-like conjugal transfer protein, CD1115 family n=1 Tax=Bacillus sp. FJAT-28004 TaxID=1679165 RepID=UPI0006B44B72|nr:type IV secretory system conjugative DNA transfer family protein [Bacillus sp. FJAT-28004]
MNISFVRKAKRITIAVILLLDIFLLPSILLLPKYLVESGADGPSLWLDSFNLFSAIGKLFEEKILLQIWGILQLLITVSIILILWSKTGLKKSKEVFGGPPAAGNGQYGSSRFQTEKEINQKTVRWKFAEAVIAGGIVFGALIPKKGDSLAWIDTDDSNSCIIGTTRSGKTRRIVFPTIWQLSYAGESILLTDPKGELYERSASFLRDQGYSVKVLDFRKPGWGNHWNPLQPVLDALDRDDEAEASQHAWSIANMFVYQKPGSSQSGGESIWKDGAESVIAALILAVAMEAPDKNQKHMYSVYKTLAELGKSRKIMIAGQETEYVALNDYMESLKMDHPARDAYATASLAPEKTRGSFFSNVASLLRLFADPSIRFLTSKQDHVLHSIGETSTAVFLIIPDEDKTRHPLAALYIDQTYKALVELANRSPKKRIPIRVNQLLDEFGNMPPIKDFDTKLTVSLGRGIRWNIILQDFNQLDIAYGEKVARVIRGNCQNLIYLLTTDDETAVKISKKMGPYTVSTEGSSFNVGKNNVSHGGNFGLAGRDLLTAEEILRWPVGKSLVIRARQHPSIFELPDLSEWPADEDFTPDDGIEIERYIGPVSFFVPDVNKIGSASTEEPSYTNEAVPNNVSFMDDVD